MKSALHILFLFAALTSNQIAYNQEDNEHNRQFFPKDYGEKIWKPLISLDARRSLYRSAPVKINGLRIGFQYLGVHRLGVGFYGLSRNVVFTNVKVNQPGSTDTSRVVFNARYGTLFYERVIYKTKKWEFAIPSEFLFGSITGFYEDSTGTFLPLPNEPFSGIAIGIQTKYNIFPWLAPRFSVGQRLLFNTSQEVKSSFNKPYYSFGIQIVIGKFYRAVKEKIDE